MAEDGSVTPEKQLLKLIEEAKGQEDSKGTPPKKKRSSGLSLDAMKGIFAGRMSFFKRVSLKQLAASSKTSISLTVVNRILGVLAVALFVYVVVDITLSAMNVNKPPQLALEEGRKITTSREVVSPLREPSYYLRQVRSKDLFGAQRRASRKKKKERVEVRAQEVTSVRDEEPDSVTDKLALVGISWSSDPDAIIEDRSKRKTFFVKMGQTFGEGIKVESIQKNRVILSYEGEEFELK